MPGPCPPTPSRQTSHIHVADFLPDLRQLASRYAPVLTGPRTGAAARCLDGASRPSSSNMSCGLRVQREPDDIITIPTLQLSL